MVFGYRLLAGPLDNPIQGVSLCFLGMGIAGEPSLELIAPAREDSPVASVLRKAIGAYHVCYEVEDLEAALGFVRSRGCVVIGKPVPAAAFAGGRIGWFYTPTRQLIELLAVHYGVGRDGRP
jgi:methylmalonyl-CoA/ethylmalonyl-CoA epimerase